MERAIVATWPDRAYFIEVGNDDEGWVQLFQPWGIPRSRLEERVASEDAAR